MAAATTAAAPTAKINIIHYCETGRCAFALGRDARFAAPRGHRIAPCFQTRDVASGRPSLKAPAAPLPARPLAPLSYVRPH